MGREPIGIRQLEQRLLRGSVDALSRDRCSCHACGRTPLEGESVAVYETRRGERILCAQCESRTSREPVEWRRIASVTARGVVRLPRAA